jgi:hypothetical protein
MCTLNHLPNRINSLEYLSATRRGAASFAVFSRPETPHREAGMARQNGQVQRSNGSVHSHHRSIEMHLSPPALVLPLRIENCIFVARHRRNRLGLERISTPCSLSYTRVKCHSKWTALKSSTQKAAPGHFSWIFVSDGIAHENEDILCRRFRSKMATLWTRQHDQVAVTKVDPKRDDWMSSLFKLHSPNIYSSRGSVAAGEFSERSAISERLLAGGLPFKCLRKRLTIARQRLFVRIGSGHSADSRRGNVSDVLRTVL